MSSEENKQLPNEVMNVSATEPPSSQDVREYRAQVLERYAEVVKRAGLPLNESGTVDWKAVIEEERAKLEAKDDS